jgi:hypothetical protein
MDELRKNSSQVINEHGAGGGKWTNDEQEEVEHWMNLVKNMEVGLPNVLYKVGKRVCTSEPSPLLTFDDDSVPFQPVVQLFQLSY